MAWTKIPPENHALFRAALPPDRRIETLLMFGGVAAKVNGHLFGGTFGRSVILLLSEPDRAKALALDGAAPFDPMGNGVRSKKVQMPESIMDDATELRDWVRRAFEHAVTLPEKVKTKKAKTTKKTKKTEKTMRTATKTTKTTKTTNASKAGAAKKPVRAAKKSPARRTSRK